MNKKEIIDYLNKYNFPSNEYLVISGAAMVMLGIKDKTNDIDIAVTEKLYDTLLGYDECIFETKDKNDDDVYFIDKLNFGKMYFSNDRIYINNIPVQTTKQIKNLKIKLNRPKDRLDLELINNFENNIKNSE